MNCQISPCALPFVKIKMLVAAVFKNERPRTSVSDFAHKATVSDFKIFIMISCERGRE
jgi:hypothetical protein